MEENNGQEETLNTQEEEVLETSQEEDTEQQEGESVEEFKARLAKAEELARNYRIRAEKAEKLAKQVGNRPTESQTKGELTTNDLYALMEAKVPQEDVSEVQDYAKLKGISITEALKAPLVKSMLAEKAEKRQTAEVTNTGTARRGSGKLSDEAFMEKISSGFAPETDEDIARYVRLRNKR